MSSKRSLPMANTGAHGVHRDQYSALEPLGLDLLPMFYHMTCLIIVSFNSLFRFILRSQAGGEMCICAGGGLEVGCGWVGFDFLDFRPYDRLYNHPFSFTI